MTVKEKLIMEIDQLDEKKLEFLYNIAYQLINIDKNRVIKSKKNSNKVVNIFQKIANSGGLGVRDPVKWQQNIRKDLKDLRKAKLKEKDVAGKSLLDAKKELGL